MRIVIFEWRAAKTFAQLSSLGIQYITASLREAGHTVHLFLFEGDPVQDVVDTIVPLQPDIVALPTTIEFKETIITIMKEMKQRLPVTIITGGHSATLHAARLLKQYPEIDIIIYGEGELTFVQLCEIIEKKGNLRDCAGIFFREGDELNRTEPREAIEDLNLLPFPALDIARSKNNPDSSYVFVSISTSRGCLANCTFCTSHRVSKFGNFQRWRGRSPQSIVQEILSLKREFPGKRLIIDFVDSSFEDPDPKGKSRIVEFLDLLEAHQLDIAFSIMTRADSWSMDDAPLIARMKRLGLYFVAPGIESASPTTLRLFGKRATVQQNEVICELLLKNQIGFHTFMIMFHPYDTFDDLRSNARFINRYKTGGFSLSWYHSLAIFPDTHIFQQIAKDGLLVGFNEQCYAYEYAFQHAKVAELFQTVEKLREIKCIGDFMSIYHRTRIEIYLFEVWKGQYEQKQEVQEIMSAYQASFRDLISSAGEQQYQLFMEMVNEAECGRLKESGPQLIHKWEERIRYDEEQLKKLWLSTQHQLMRKRYHLL
jgi:radical SAM superfamily enzyme YgiQ (UPF0313 family)